MKLTRFLVFVFLSISHPVFADDLEWALARGQEALGADNPSLAFDIFSEAALKAPDDLRFVYLAGIAAERTNKFDEAASRLTQADTPAGRKLFKTLDLDLGRVFYKQAKYAEAEKRLAAYAASNADDAMGFLWLAETKLALGKDDEAFSAFNRAGKPEPRLRPVFHFTRGTRIFSSNPGEASEEMKKAIDLDRDGKISVIAERFNELALQKDDLERWYSVDAALGVQSDSNMLKHTQGDKGQSYSGQRLVFSGAGFVRPKIGEHFFIGVGASVNQSQTLSAEPARDVDVEGGEPEFDKADFNAGSHTFFADGSYYVPFETFSLETGVEYGLHTGLLGGELYDLSHSIHPRLTWFHSTESASKFYGIFQSQSVSEIKKLAPLAEGKSGILAGAGFAHYLVFSNRLDALSVFGEFVLKSADSKAESYSGPRGGLNGRKRLVADLYLDAGAFAALRGYADNPIHKSETLVTADGGPGYLLFQHLEIDLNAAYTANLTQDEPFAYKRLLLGVFVRGIY